MKFTNNMPINSIQANANITSKPVDLSQIVKMSAQLIIGSGTASGSIQLQVSNDLLRNSYLIEDNVITNWSNLGAPTAISGSGVTLLPQQDMCYRIMRVVYTDTSVGTGTSLVTVQLMLLGI